MLPLPSIPDSAPFSAEQWVWLDGYLAGLFSRATASAATLEAAPEVPLTILYGTQTGSAAALSKKIAAAAKKRAIKARVVDMCAATLDLARETNLLIVTST